MNIPALGLGSFNKDCIPFTMRLLDADDAPLGAEALDLLTIFVRSLKRSVRKASSFVCIRRREAVE